MTNGLEGGGPSPPPVRHEVVFGVPLSQANTGSPLSVGYLICSWPKEIYSIFDFTVEINRNRERLKRIHDVF